MLNQKLFTMKSSLFKASSPSFLFPSAPEAPLQEQTKALCLPPGATYAHDYISLKEENRLLSLIDASPWLDSLKRRVQHYGFLYDYRSRRIDYSMYLGPLPTWASYFAQELYNSGLIGYVADQVIVNEYLPGQGISPHIDCTPCFEDSIVSISLGSDCVMNLINPTDKRQVDVLLSARSVMSLCGEARYQWQHGIKSVKNDFYNGQRIARERRVSLTFRKVKLSNS